MNEVKHIVQPYEILKLLNLKNLDVTEVEKVIATTLEFLIYMRTGDELKTSFGNFEKIAHDLFHVASHVKNQDIIDTLEKRKIIKFPI